MSVRLDELVGATREAVHRRKRERPLAELEREAGAQPEGRPFAEALARPGTSLIAEHKRRSPSAGTIREGAQLRRRSCQRLRARRRGRAVSVLTEEAHFGGSLADLREARAAIRAADAAQGLHDRPLPALRGQGRRRRRGAAGGRRDGRRTSSRALYREAHALDLDAIVEIHDRGGARAGARGRRRRARHQQPQPRGLQVDIQRTFDLLADVPAGKVVVSESGHPHAASRSRSSSRSASTRC